MGKSTINSCLNCSYLLYSDTAAHGYTKVRYRGLAKNTVQIVTLFALSNLWMARRSLMGRAGMSASAALCGAASKGTETIM